MTGSRAFALILFAALQIGHEIPSANRWDIDEEIRIPIPAGARWELSDWNGDGMLDLMLFDGRTIRIRLQTDRNTWVVSDSFTVDDSHVVADVLDSFTTGNASSLLLAGRDSLRLVMNGSAGVSLAPAYPVRMPCGAAAKVLLPFPFAARGAGWRGFAVPTSDSLLLFTATGRFSIPGGALTEVRGRRMIVTSPRVVPAHWNDDGFVDLIVIDEADLAVHTGEQDGSFRPRAEVRISFQRRSESDRASDEIVRVAVCDLEGDGLADLVVAGEPKDPLDAYLSVAVHRNHGAGCGPLPDQVLTLDSWGRLLPTCDRDGDGLADLRVQTAATGTGAILRALASGTVPVHSRLYVQTEDGVFVRREQGDFSVQADWNDDRGSPVRFDDASDWNADGLRDMLIVSDHTLSLNQTTDGSSFATKQTSRWHCDETEACDYRVRDVDGDGVIDLTHTKRSTGAGARRELLIALGVVRIH